MVNDVPVDSEVSVDCGNFINLKISQPAHMLNVIYLYLYR